MGFFNRGQGETLTLDVQGMTCGHCETRVAGALKEIDGVRDASADHQAARATVTLQAGKTVPRDKMVAAVKEAGYEAAE